MSSRKEVSKVDLTINSEVGTLKRVMIHSPDGGLGRVVPSKAQDWLFEDIIHLDMMRKDEYDYFVKTLLYFLDPEKVKGKLASIDHADQKRQFYKPHAEGYFNSDKVIEPQFLLSQILENQDLKVRIVAAISAVEQCTFDEQDELLALSPKELSKTLISGAMPNGEMMFAPVPNFIFTRDIGVVINDHVLLNRPANVVRYRESLIMQYIFHHHPYFAAFQGKIIEIPDDEEQFFLSDDEFEMNQVTLEGGDVMVVGKQHILIGLSERTSHRAVNQAIKILFEKNILKKATVIKIPKKRDFMHIDTIFTQVSRNVWVLFGGLSKKNKEYLKKDFILEEIADDDLNTLKKPEIIQFHKGREHQPVYFDYLEDLLDDISQNDLQSPEPTKFIYSGGHQFPNEVREQWTDSCNVLAIKEGVVIGYDRNLKTAEAFEKEGFKVVKAQDLINSFENGDLQAADIKNTLILIPSAELSRARGGSHCMSMPLWRDEL